MQRAVRLALLMLKSEFSMFLLSLLNYNRPLYRLYCVIVTDLI